MVKDGAHVVVADVIGRMAMQIPGSAYGVLPTPSRITRTLLELEWERRCGGVKPHPLADIHAAFALLVPQERR